MGRGLRLDGRGWKDDRALSLFAPVFPVGCANLYRRLTI
jgi:hypothetical protein